MRKKIKVSFKDVYDALIELSKRKDLKSLDEVVVEGEDFNSDYKFSIGEKVFVRPYVEKNSWNDDRRVLGARWGTIVDTNANSPKKEEEGISYFVEGSDKIGGWELQENLELIK